MKEVYIKELTEGGPEPMLISDWLRVLRSLKRKHGDVVVVFDAGSNDVVFRALVPEERKCDHCGRILQKRTNSCRCGAWTNPRHHYQLKKDNGSNPN